MHTLTNFLQALAMTITMDHPISRGGWRLYVGCKSHTDSEEFVPDIYLLHLTLSKVINVSSLALTKTKIRDQ